MKLAKLVEIKQILEDVMKDYHATTAINEKRVYTMAKMFNEELDRVIRDESTKAYAGQSAARFIIDMVDDKNTLPFSNHKQAQGGAKK